MPVPIDDARADYRHALATFPFEFPPGYCLPGESSELRTVTSFEAPWWYNPAAEVFFSWRACCAAAARSAFERGDHAECRKLLDAIRSAYLHPHRRQIVEDPDLGYLRDVLSPAMAGDFTEIAKQDTDRYPTTDWFTPEPSTVV